VTARRELKSARVAVSSQVARTATSTWTNRAAVTFADAHFPG
jgi:hypothetical protein